MKNISFLLVGIFLGVLFNKSEVISWFRIHEMFRFESFHMYGVIGTAVFFGALFMFILKRFQVKTLMGHLVSYTPMKLNWKRHILAGTLFGLGWGLVGSCPGPMYALLGNGYGIFLVIIASAVFGTFTYGVIKDSLPH